MRNATKKIFQVALRSEQWKLMICTTKKQYDIQRSYISESEEAEDKKRDRCWVVKSRAKSWATMLTQMLRLALEECRKKGAMQPRENVSCPTDGGEHRARHMFSLFARFFVRVSSACATRIFVRYILTTTNSSHTFALTASPCPSRSHKLMTKSRIAIQY